MLQEKIGKQLEEIKLLIKKKDEKPLSFKEACSYLGYAPSYLYKLTSSGKIPHYKPSGKMLFFSKAELDDWIFGRYGAREEAGGNMQEGRSEEREVRNQK